MNKSNSFLKFCLGTVQFGKTYGLKNIRDVEITDETIEAIFKKFIDNGGVYIDTAKNYGNSEKRISKFLKPELKVISKFQLTNKKGKLADDVKESLDDLGISKLDTALIHNPEYLNPSLTNIDELIDLKNMNLCSNIGISIYSHDDIFYKSNADTEELLSLIDILQIQANAFDKSFFNDKKIENIKKHNIRVDIRSIFLQGLLLQGKESAINLFPNFHAEISSWHDYCKYNKLSLLEASILNVLNLYEGKSLILFGCRSLNEIEEILDALSADNKLTNNFVSYFSNNLTDPRLWNK